MALSPFECSVSSRSQPLASLTVSVSPVREWKLNFLLGRIAAEGRILEEFLESRASPPRFLGTGEIISDQRPTHVTEGERHARWKGTGCGHPAGFPGNAAETALE
jgi:hypothetical protein